MVHGAMRGILIGAILLAAAPLVANEARVLEQTDSEILFELATDDVSLSEVSHGGESFVRIDAPGYGSTTDAGAPRLPRKAVLLAVPFGAEYDLEVVSVETRSLGRHRVEPAPEERFESDGGFLLPVQEFRVDPTFETRRTAYPGPAAALGASGRLRHHRVVRVVLHPFSYVPATDALTLRTRIVVRLRIRGGAVDEGMRPAPGGEESWDAVYGASILNADASVGWRARPRPSESYLRHRFESRDEAWKIRIGESGIYRIDHADLSAAGFPSSHAVEDVALFTRSFDASLEDPFVETPVSLEMHDVDEDGAFDGDDYLLFMGLSFEEALNDSGFQDRWTTENVYWLAPDPALAARMATRPASHGWTGLTPPASFRDTLRFEEDEYFLLTPPNDRVDLWTWTDYLENSDSYLLPFTVHDMAPTPDVRLTGRWHGRTNDVHRIDLTVLDGADNETDLGVYTFTGVSKNMDEDIYVSGVLPAGALTEGQNRLRCIGLGDAGTNRSGADLDWFSIAYERLFRAQSGRLSFTNAGETGQAEFRVEGFGSEALSLFDVTDPYAPVALSLGSENTSPDTDVALIFQDSVGAFTRYEALQEDGALEPLGIERRQGAALATDEADMVVVSYDGFSSAVDAIVNYRRSQGWVVAHARLSEVYDEFGGGLPSDVAIRNYCRYAFENWTRTPQYVLLVGDASEDMRGIESSAAPNYMPTHVFRGTSGGKLVGSDQWFVSFVDDDLHLPQIMIGRLPSSGTDEVALVADKIASFESTEDGGAWRNRVLMVADDDWSYPSLDPDDPYLRVGWEDDFRASCLELADTVAQSPVGFDTVNFILSRYTHPYHAVNYPGGIAPINYAFQTVNYVRNEAGATDDLVDRTSDGALIVNFVGHGNRTQLTHEQLILGTVSTAYNDIVDFENAGKPFFFIGVSCELARFHDATEGNSIDCITEQMLHLDGGRGAVATFACVGSSRQTWNRLLDFNTFRAYFGNRDGTEEFPRWTVGGIVTQGVIGAVIEQGYSYESRTFMLFGDPALRVNVNPAIRATVDGEDVDNGSYLDLAEGGHDVAIVVDMINGIEIDPSTIAVTETDIGPIDPSEYTVVAMSDTAAARSRWYRISYSTTLRAEWNYQIRFTATDMNGEELLFFLRVPGGEEPDPPEFQGTVDGERFTSGDHVDVTEGAQEILIVAEVESEIAINPESIAVTETDIGEIDTSEYTVEAVADTGDAPPRRYIVTYAPTIRAEASYDIRFAAMDYAGQEAGFIVRVPGGDEAFHIDQVANHPNPFSTSGDGGTSIIYRLNRPAEDVTLRIFTVGGRLIRVFEDAPADLNYNAVVWDGMDAQGDQVANGVYLYVIDVETSDGETSSSDVGRMVKMN